MGEVMRRTNSDPDSLRYSGNFLRQELPVRFARRIEDFLRLPHVVVCNGNLNNVLSSYVHFFEALQQSTEINTVADEGRFLHLIVEQIHAQKEGVRFIAAGYRDVRMMYPDIRLDDFLHVHFTTRIACRILMDNYVAMRNPRPNHIGIVRQGMRPCSIVQSIVRELTDMTRTLRGRSPEVEYRGNLDCLLDYIPAHLQYMLREVLKNAFRATLDRNLEGNGPLPPVIVELQQGDMHVIIKVSDQGGGLSKQLQADAWQYGWTSMTDGKKDELAGFGFGLPLTRLFAQYFGGDVFMQALPGLGTDMYLVLTHLKAGTPSTEIDDLSTVLYRRENLQSTSVGCL